MEDEYSELILFNSLHYLLYRQWEVDRLSSAHSSNQPEISQSVSILLFSSLTVIDPILSPLLNASLPVEGFLPIRRREEDEGGEGVTRFRSACNQEYR